MSPSDPGSVSTGKTMYQLLRETVEKYPHHIAYIFQGQRTSYRQFLTRIDASARGLVAMGIGKGDRVAICMPNSPQALHCFYALNRIGAIATMIHPLSAAQEISLFLNTSKSKAILTLDAFYHKVASVLPQLHHSCAIFVARIADELPYPWNVIYSHTKAGKHPLPKTGYTLWHHMLCAGTDLLQLPPDLGNANDCAAILFSGGTTGTPKGVCLTSENFNTLALQAIAASGFDHIAGMKMLSVLPMFHGFGLGIGIHTPLVAGATCILLPNFSEDLCTKALLRYQPELLPGVPTLFEALLRAKRLQKADLSFLKGIFCGGDSLSPELQQKVNFFLHAHHCSFPIRQGYGSTECLAAATLTPPDRSKSDSVGLPMPGNHIQIVLPNTQTPVAPNQEGEICISGPTVMQGYADAPEETAATLQRHDDGRIWLHTGDLGFVDPDGWLYFRQRIKRIIITSGYNVYPSQLESVLDGHPSVQQSCCIGVPDAYRGQRIRAYIVPVPGVTPSPELEETLRSHCAQHIARYALPREFIFRTDLPHTAVGKVAYHLLASENSEKEHS